MPITLPTELSLPSFDPGKFTLLLHGVPKIGKSTWASQIKDGIFLATEPGLECLERYEIPIKGWVDILEAGAALLGQENRFKTIVIDTIDKAYNLCAEYVCQTHKIGHQSDLGHGKGWHFVTAELVRVLTKLARSDKGLVLISHTKEQEVETPVSKYLRYAPSLSGKAGEEVMALADIILFFTSELAKDEHGEPVETRVIKTKASRGYIAGDRTGKLPETLPMDYGKFVEAMNNIRKGEIK